MAIFSNNGITDRGRIMLAEMQMGAVFTPTRIVIGSGNLPAGTTIEAMTDVITPVKSMGINKKERTPDGKCIFGCNFTNEDITYAFYFRELALYAKTVYVDAAGNVTREGEETLYSYGNAGETADLMPAYSTTTAVERQLDLIVWVGNNTVVNLTVDSSFAVRWEDFANHAARHKVGGDDPLSPEDIGAAPKDHASNDGGYGIGSGSLFGHVKLTDEADQSYDANGGFAVTPKAVATLFSLLSNSLASHKTDTATHADIRLELKTISDRINAVLDSDDATLDELSEIVAYIKSNKTLIDAITTSKVSVTDIVDDLVTNVKNKPLSAAQGVLLKSMIDTLQAACGKVPTNHAAADNTYGVGNGTNYGHVKLSDATNGSSNANGGVAATPAAVKAAYDLANGKAAASHNQAASTITAGTFAGQVVANSSGQAPGTSLLRNSKLASAETNPTVNGEICWTYE